MIQERKCPYARHLVEKFDQPDFYRARVVENSFSPSHYTQLVLDLGAAPGFHDSVEIGVGEDEFMEWVEVDASDDAQVWRIVQERAPIFPVPARRPRRNATRAVFREQCPVPARPDPGRRPSSFRSGPRRLLLKSPHSRRSGWRWASSLLPTKPDGPNATAWSADLGTNRGVPIREVRFDVGPGEFVREVTIKTSDDNSLWSPIGDGEIFRFTPKRPRVRAAFGAAACSRCVMCASRVANGNDAPLDGIVPKLYVTPQRIVFEQKPGRSYRLIYGESEAKPRRDTISGAASASRRWTSGARRRPDLKKSIPDGPIRGRGRKATSTSSGSASRSLSCSLLTQRSTRFAAQHLLKQEMIRRSEFDPAGRRHHGDEKSTQKQEGRGLSPALIDR